MNKHRGHKQHEVEDISELVDHISNLHDCIVHHILSFMSTKEVVKTSILSTRWKTLWASVPNIDFDDKLLYGREVDDVISFANIVGRALQLRGGSNIKKFHLSCRVFRDASRIRSWVSNAIMHKVQELDLTLFGVAPSVIPQSMFESTSLVSLKIRMNCAIQLPSYVSFPCLKTLQLFCVQFLHDYSTEKFFSGCPVLEELVLFRNCFKSNISISSSSLKSLTIDYRPSFWDFADHSGCKMKIDAPNLTNFEYTGSLSNEILLENVSSLVKAFINIPSLNKGRKEVICRAVGLLERLQCVVFLRLSNHILESLFLVDMRWVRIPEFSNLTHLTLTTKIGMSDTFGVLLGLLSSCPVLQSICFSEGFKRFTHLAVNQKMWLSVPICMSNGLKTLTFKNFHGYTIEICFLKWVLKYACVLERMDIWWSETYLRDLKKKRKARKELEKIERKATSCVIKFS